MRRIRRHRKKKLNKIIVLSAFCLLFVITAGYAAFSTNISLHVKGNILEGTRVIQVWDENSKADFHSDYYKQNILTITFLNNNNVPENAVESWNVSEDKERGTVKAWVVSNSSDSSKYDLYIGAKGKVIANEDSGYVFYDFRGVKEINFDNNYDTSNAVDMTKMFMNCTNLQALDLSTFDTRDVTSMYAMFCMWDGLNNIGLESKIEYIKFGNNFITDNVQNMRSMFAGLRKLKELDVSNFNTSNVTTMYHMFTECDGLKELDLSSFDTSKVTDMEQMFGESENLETLDLSNFNTTNVTNMKWMFQGCSNLTNLNIRSFNTSKVTDMEGMFAKCSNIIELDLCSFNTSNAVNMKWMFGETPNLKLIKVSSNWTTNNADTQDMFVYSNISSVTTGQC